MMHFQPIPKWIPNGERNLEKAPHLNLEVRGKSIFRKVTIEQDSLEGKEYLNSIKENVSFIHNNDEGYFNSKKLKRVRISLFSTLLDIFGDRKDESGVWKVSAWKAYNEIIRNVLQPDDVNYSDVISYLLKENKEKEARLFIKQMKENGIKTDEETYAIVLKHSIRG